MVPSATRIRFKVVGMYRDWMSCLSAMVRQQSSRGRGAPSSWVRPIAPARFWLGQAADTRLLPLPVKQIEGANHGCNIAF